MQCNRRSCCLSRAPRPPAPGGGAGGLQAPGGVTAAGEWPPTPQLRAAPRCCCSSPGSGWVGALGAAGAPRVAELGTLPGAVQK